MTSMPASISAPAVYERPSQPVSMVPRNLGATLQHLRTHGSDESWRSPSFLFFAETAFLHGCVGEAGDQVFPLYLGRPPRGRCAHRTLVKASESPLGHTLPRPTVLDWVLSDVGKEITPRCSKSTSDCSVSALPLHGGIINNIRIILFFILARTTGYSDENFMTTVLPRW